MPPYIILPSCSTAECNKSICVNIKKTFTTRGERCGENCTLLLAYVCTHSAGFVLATFYNNKKFNKQNMVNFHPKRKKVVNNKKKKYAGLTYPKLRCVQSG